MFVATLLAFLIYAEAPGPSDAFKRNYREAKVSVRFVYRLHVLHGLPPSSPSHVILPGWEPGSVPRLTVTGLWESDGTTEHIVIIPEDIKHGPGDKKDRVYAFPFESLYDGKTFAYHRFDERRSLIEVRKTLRPFIYLYGPFEWWNTPFPLFLNVPFAGAKVSRSSRALDGRPIETEFYRQAAGAGFMRLVMNYDPAIGHLPVYIRGFSYNPNSEVKRSNFKECYMISSRPCAAGGFVPMEWVDTFFGVAGFDPDSPRYKDDSPLKPMDPVAVGHFKVLAVVDNKAQVALAPISHPYNSE